MRATTLRTYTKIEDAMLRAAMPKTSALDPVPTFTHDGLRLTVANRGLTRLVRVVPTLTVSIGERARMA